MSRGSPAEGMPERRVLGSEDGPVVSLSQCCQGADACSSRLLPPARQSEAALRHRPGVPGSARCRQATPMRGRAPAGPRTPLEAPQPAGTGWRGALQGRPGHRARHLRNESPGHALPLTPAAGNGTSPPEPPSGPLLPLGASLAGDAQAEGRPGCCLCSDHEAAGARRGLSGQAPLQAEEFPSRQAGRQLRSASCTAEARGQRAGLHFQQTSVDL